jgi:hypothetical protein
MPTVSHKIQSSLPAPNGIRTVLDSQMIDGAFYLDAAGIPGRVVGVREK